MNKKIYDGQIRCELNTLQSSTNIPHLASICSTRLPVHYTCDAARKMATNRTEVFVATTFSAIRNNGVLK